MRARPWLWSTLERGPGWKCCEHKAGTGPFSRRHPQPSSAKAREQRPGRDGKAGQGHAECQGQGCSAGSKEHPPAVGASASPSGVLGSSGFLQQPGIPTAFAQLLEKRARGGKVSVQPRPARCLPVSPWSRHLHTQGREGLSVTPGTPNPRCSCPSTPQRTSWLGSQAQAAPCIPTRPEQAADSPGGGSKTQPHSSNTSARAKPGLPVPPPGSSTLQCQLHIAWQLLSAILPPQHGWQGWG